MPTNQFRIQMLGKPNYLSPIQLCGSKRYIGHEDKIAYNPYLPYLHDSCKNQEILPAFEIAGARHQLYFDPVQTRVGIVTCGGLCPGVNAVIRGLVLQLFYRYKCRQIIGYRFGFQGLSKGQNKDKIFLTPEKVSLIHEQGGTILGTSRGGVPVEEMIHSLKQDDIQILFTVGGDGTMRGAQVIADEIYNRGLNISVIGIPKTIDNDIPYVRRSFGFETAVSIASHTIKSAYTEAASIPYGIGLVKLMGRHAGYIAANASLAAGHTDLCLIPESDFNLEGPQALFSFVKKRLESKKHIVIVVAEGSGQKFFQQFPKETDASGNTRLKDIGVFLKQALSSYFEKETGFDVSIKYIDPSYIIRSSPANAVDKLFCVRLAQNAVHAAMAGKTNMLIGYWHGRMTHVPFKALENKTKSIQLNGDLWFNILESTGQPMDIL